MIEVFDYAAPYGVIGRAVERVLLDAYMERFLMRRAQVIKQIAESNDWRRFMAG